MRLGGRHRSLDAQSDEQLAALSAAGDAGAFALLVGRHRPQLLSLARRIAGSERAEDVLQESLLDAWSALSSGTEVTHVRGWLFQIVRHASWKASRQVTPCELPETLVGAESPEGALELSGHVEKVMSEMTRLPAHEQLALMQTAVEGHSAAEVAECLGVTEGAARQLVYRARTRLRRACTVLVPAPILRWLGYRLHGAGQPGVDVAGGGAASAGAVVGVVKAMAVLATVSAVAVGAHAEIKRLSRHGSATAGGRVVLSGSRSAGPTGSGSTPSRTVAHDQSAAAAGASPAPGTPATVNPAPTPAPAQPSVSRGDGGSQPTDTTASTTTNASSTDAGTQTDPAASDASAVPVDPSAAADSSSAPSDTPAPDQAAGSPPADSTPPVDTTPVDPTSTDATPTPDPTGAGSVQPADVTSSTTAADGSTTPADPSATTTPSN